MTLSRCGRQYTFEDALKSAQARGFSLPGSVAVELGITFWLGRNMANLTCDGRRSFE